MRHTNVKNALLGLALALVAAYTFPAALLTLMMGPRALRILFSPVPVVGLLYGSWILIPLGAALGMLIPRIAAGKSRWKAALHGAGYGAVGGLAAMICFASVYDLRPGLDLLVVSAAAYSAVWVGAYAYVRAKPPVPHR
ncbi:MAG TPA: hypothetical protein VD861_12840 [Pyrinomonadaceae bacterium]|nr:hypothetical protein [Pyrinomonadaceae bacterium]